MLRMWPKYQIVSFIIFGLFIAGWFLWFAGDGLWADFSGDDLMNLHYYWKQPLWRTIISNIWFPTSYSRPLGAAFYLPIYYVFGLNPFPFRVVCIILLFINLLLLYQFTRVLTQKEDMAFLAVFLASYHAWFVDIYYSSGTIYEILCFTGYFFSFNRYLTIRQNNKLLKAKDWWIVGIGYLIALNAKELAVTLPISMIIYELLFHFQEFKLLRKWFWNEARPALIMGLITIPYCIAKLSFGPMADNPAYHPIISAKIYVDAFHIYLNPFLYQDHWFRDNNTGQLMGALLIFCLLMKRRDLLFSWSFTLFSVLPFIFIPHFAAFFWYLPMVGWAVLTAGLFLALWQGIVKVFERFVPDKSIKLVLSTALLVPMLFTLAGFLFRQHTRETPIPYQHFMNNQAPISPLVKKLEQEKPEVTDGAIFVLVDDPFHPDWYTPLQIVQLLYDNQTLRVERYKSINLDLAKIPPFELALLYDEDKYITITSFSEPTFKKKTE
ncbi:MAG: glycosyltransferase family 39 protein [Acidobacteriota bacterium]